MVAAKRLAAMVLRCFTVLSPVHETGVTSCRPRLGNAAIRAVQLPCVKTLHRGACPGRRSCSRRTVRPVVWQSDDTAKGDLLLIAAGELRPAWEQPGPSFDAPARIWLASRPHRGLFAV